MKTTRRTTEVTDSDGVQKSIEVTEEPRSWFDAVSSYIAVIIALVTAITGVVAYRTGAVKDASLRDFEAKKPFFERQATYYSDAMLTVAKLATSERPSDDELSNFWQLYWGRLAAVEDDKVDEVMVIVGKLVGPRSGPGKLGEPDWSTNRVACLKDASLLLAHCVKKSWEITWKVELGAPPEFPCTDASVSTLENCAKNLAPKAKP